MLRKIISLVTLICFISYLYGCSSVEVVQLNESNIDEFDYSDIVSVVTKDNKIYEFETNGLKPKPQITDSVLKGWLINEQFQGSYKIHEVEIPVDQLKTLQIKETNATTTLLAIACIGALVGVVILLIFEPQLGGVDF